MLNIIKYINLIFCILFSLNVNAQCDIIATSSGSNLSYTQVYVLVDDSGNIVAENNSGFFTSVGTGVYHVHALNYDPSNPPTPMPSSLIGQAVTLVGSVTNGCYNADFLTDFVTRICAGCVESRTICESDNFTVSTSGENTSYTQLYVLTDVSTGLIIDVNSTGIFTGMVLSGNSYQVYALNYDPLQPPSPMPTVGQTVNDVGTISTGCYNSDFLSDFLCYSVTDCLTGCYRISSICAGQDIVVSASGANQLFEQYYILTDNTDNFIDANITGVFPTASLAAGDYRVHAINYNPSDPPSPLPVSLSAGDAISTISGGCFNTEFLNDYLCFNLNCLLANNLLDFHGELLDRNNMLIWNIEHPEEVDSFILQRSESGYSKFETINSQGSVEMHHFSFLDKSPLSDSYYRLKILNKEGKVEYSNIVFLHQQSVTYNVYPNPTDGNLNIQIFSPRASGVAIKVIGMLGQMLKEYQFHLTEGKNLFQLDLDILPSGIYCIELRTENEISETKFLKR